MLGTNPIPFYIPLIKSVHAAAFSIVYIMADAQDMVAYSLPAPHRS